MHVIHVYRILKSFVKTDRPIYIKFVDDLGILHNSLFISIFSLVKFVMKVNLLFQSGTSWCGFI